MALPYEVNFTVLDGEGNRASGGFFIDSNQTVANAVTEAEGMLSDLQDDCLGKVESANLLVPIDVSGFATAPDAGSNAGYGHRWNGSSAEGHRSVINLPAADPANAVSGSHVLSDVALNPAKVITDGIVTRALTTSHDEPLTVVNSKYETWGGRKISA